MKVLIKFEGLALLLLSLYLYFFVFDFSVLLLIALLFVPDVSMVGYALNNRLGAYSYNVIHSLITPSILFMVGLNFKSDVLISLA